ncbi:MAG: CBS domain-containing protein [Candidatus Methanomethylicia archaeon]|jgi:predicted transcriptional regulator|uniref:CBS domain-containing protein n=1 Tax=Thermodesulfobium narugense TaxID=184064 RepID=A0A7C5KBS9_9BACT|nr:CBS domain-containing protein [Candidatus Methanomethylicia archaeon]
MVGLPPTPQELRILRKRAGLTQKELAKKAGISQSLVARIESGSVDPRVSTLRKILNVLSEEVSEVKLSAGSIMHQPVISVELEESIGKAVELMWKHGISQLPVFQNDKLVGSIREDTILKKLKDENIKELLKRKVSYLKEDPFPVVNVNTSVENVTKLLLSGSPAVLVNDHGRMVGIITKIDLIAKHIM